MSNVLMTPEGHEILKWADRSARQRHQSLVDTEHLLDAALQHNLARRALAAGGVDPDSLLDILLMELGLVRDEPLKGTLGLTKQAIQRLESTEALAQSMGQSSVNSAHIALAMLMDPEPLMADILKRLPPLDLTAMRRYIQEKSPKTEGTRANVTKLDRKTVEQARKRRLNENLRQQNKNAPRIIITSSRSNTRNPYLPYIIAGVIALLVIYGFMINASTTVAILIVLVGWIFSVVIHEFAHAIVAYWGGDYTVADKGYLSLNPLKYTHPMLSIGLPLLFLAMGGIGLPGGAVYIETHRLRNKYWRTAVALAGPVGSFLCLVVFSAPFWTGMVSTEMIYQFPMASLVADRYSFWSALALLSSLQVMAIMFNLIPLPPLDGFNAVEPFLPPDMAHQIRSTIGMMGIFILLILFWFTPLSKIFFEQVWQVTDWVHIPRILISDGFDTVLFWRQNN